MVLLLFELRSLFLIIVTCCARTSFSFSVSPGWTNPSSTIATTTATSSFSSSSSVSSSQIDGVNIWKRNRRCFHVIRNAIADSNTLDDNDLDSNILLDIDLDEIPPAADFIDPSTDWVTSSSSKTTAVTRREDSTLGNVKNEFPSLSVVPNGSGAIEATTAAAAPTTAAISSTYVRCGVCSSHFSITPEDLGGERSKGRRLECSVCGNIWFQSKDRILKLRPGMELVALPAMDWDRVRRNREEGKPLNFVGDAKLYVGNLSFDCTEQLLYETFSKFGTVGEISMVYDNDSGRPRGFAFVTMRTRDDAQNLLQQQEGGALQIMGRELSIREANT